MREDYIPEYNPNKYKKAYKLCKKMSHIVLILAFVVPVIIMSQAAFTDKYAGTVKGVYTKNWDVPILFSLLAFGMIGVVSLLFWVAYKRLKQSNAVFSEIDEDKRRLLYEKFNAEAQISAEIALKLKNIENNLHK